MSSVVGSSSLSAETMFLSLSRGLEQPEVWLESVFSLTFRWRASSREEATTNQQ